MRKLYVIDTNSLIAFYKDIFRQSFDYKGSPELSKSTKKIIEHAIIDHATDIRISIPSIVFIEIFDKWLKTEEFLRLFYYEVYTPIKCSPNIQIRSTDREVLENLIYITGDLENHDLHDKIILATAMTLESPLITTDKKLIEYVNQSKVVPRTLS